jgi:hypothetical protein
MDNLSELKAIWQTASLDSLPQAEEMIRIVRKYRGKKLLGIIAVLLTTLFLTGLLIVITVIYKSEMLSTRLGEVFMIIASLVLLGSKFSSLVRFYRLKDHGNKDFILFLERTRQRQLFYYKRTQIVGFIFCTAGLLLYPYEGVHRMPAVFIGSYSALIAYLAFLWLFVRPKVFKRQEKKMQEKIDKFEILLKQMEI